MHSKRVIFTLLFGEGRFMLSRNFRLQAIGDIDWLERNYGFESIAAAIDELIVVDVSRERSNGEHFRDTLRRLTRTCFTPITAGGGVRSVDDARLLLRSGADKVLVNTPAWDRSALVEDLAAHYGAQCVVAAADIAMIDGRWEVRTHGGTHAVPGHASEVLAGIVGRPIGDLYLNSIDRDGTGQGYLLELLDLLPADLSVPVILAGGAGKPEHLEAGLREPRVDAVATAHLLNFVGDGLAHARHRLVAAGIPLPARNVDVRTLRA